MSRTPPRREAAASQEEPSPGTPARDPDSTGLLSFALSTHTHFFRGEAELEEAMSVLAARAASGRSPRLWCAGCSVGAEPYSLAILCAERGIDAVIHATDLNAEALAVARAARYPEIALRRAPPELRDRYFVREGAEHVVVPDIVRRVTFSRADLRTDPLPLPPADGDAGWDVILCRNVLIYYDPDVAGAIAERLATALRADGLLIVGSTDPLAFRPVGSLRAVGLNGVASYVRAGHGPPVTGPPALAPPSIEAPRWTPPEVVPSPLPPPPPAPPPRDAPADELTALLHAACAHLAAHVWDEAEDVLERAERASPLAPEPPLYLGVLRRKQGRLAQAAEHLRRAVFLSPRCWIASYLLAGTWDKLGDRRRAHLELTRTLETLAAVERGEARPVFPIGADSAGLAFDPVEVARACRARLRA